MMFFVGEKFRDIKVACLVDCANCFHKGKNIEKAIKYYEQALRLDSNDYYATIGMAGVLVINKSFKEALDFFKRAISVKKPDILTLILMFVAYKASGEDDSAENVLKEIIAFFNNDKANAFDHVSNTFFELDMLKEAEYYSRKVLEIYPNEVGPHYNLANIYLFGGNFEMARNEFGKVLEAARGKHCKKERQYIKHAKRELDKLMDLSSE